MAQGGTSLLALRARKHASQPKPVRAHTYHLGKNRCHHTLWRNPAGSLAPARGWGIVSHLSDSACACIAAADCVATSSRVNASCTARLFSSLRQDTQNVTVKCTIVLD